MSYYLKYRPQKTSELDIASVRDFYQGILQSGTYAHAYLFSGPRGTGKTSSARILAKLLNCEQNAEAIKNSKPLQEPCGGCGMCKRISKGSSLSVVEMDGASNRGIDDIRALRDRIALSPAEGAFVIYIIDEVHMLTTEAFNALLKTLEEPPKHAIFALCTTELSKLPATIVSRCTQVLFPKPSVAEVSASLAKAVAGEKLTVSNTALIMLASSVDGSFRDGMKLLEQLAQKGSSISDELVAQLMQKTTQYNPENFINSLMTKKIDTALAVIRQGEADGMDFTVFTRHMLEALRQNLLTSIEKNSSQVADLCRLIEGTAKALLEMKQAYIPQLPLELLAAEWCLNISSEYSVVSSQQDTVLKQKSLNQSKEQLPSSVIKKVDLKAEQKPKVLVSMGEGKLSLTDLENRWNEILSKVKPLNHSLEALLRSSRPAGVHGAEVTIEVFYKFHKDRLEETKYREAIEDVMTTLFGIPVRLQFTLSGTAPLKTKGAGVKTRVNEDSELVAAAEEIFS